MVIRVQAGREEDGRNVLRRKIEMIAAEEELFLWPQVGCYDQLQLGMLGAHLLSERAQRSILLANRDYGIRMVAADHVDVDVGHDLLRCNRRMLDEVFRSKQSLLLAANQQKD